MYINEYKYTAVPSSSLECKKKKKKRMAQIRKVDTKRPIYIATVVINEGLPAE